VVEDHPNCSFADLWGVSNLLAHDPILSKNGVSGNPGAVQFILTDDGYTIEDLEQTGCKLESRKRQDLLRMTLNGFGVQMEDKALQVHASPDNFALRKHNLVQAMLAVNDMFYLAVPMVASLFYEDVVAWLDFHDVRYTPKAKFTGKTGYDHLFDFVIPKSRKQPERIIQTINRPSRDTAQAVVLSWIDTKEVRSPDSRAYALLNDSEQAVSPAVVEALRSYYSSHNCLDILRVMHYLYPHEKHRRQTIDARPAYRTSAQRCCCCSGR